MRLFEGVHAARGQRLAEYGDATVDFGSRRSGRVTRRHTEGGEVGSGGGKWNRDGMFRRSSRAKSLRG